MRVPSVFSIPGALATLLAAGPPDPLAAPQRQTMLRLVQACPGLTVRALQARLSYQWSSFYLHLRRLVDAGHIRVETDPQDARIRRIFPVTEGVASMPAPPRPPVLKGLSLELARLVVAQPGLDFPELTALLGTPSRNVHYHLKRLCELGLVTSGSTTRYRDLRPTPALLRAIEAASPPSEAAPVAEAQDTVRNG